MAHNAFETNILTVNTLEERVCFTRLGKTRRQVLPSRSRTGQISAVVVVDVPHVTSTNGNIIFATVWGNSFHEFEREASRICKRDPLLDLRRRVAANFIHLLSLERIPPVTLDKVKLCVYDSSFLKGTPAEPVSAMT